MKFNDIDKIYFLHLSDRYDREEWMNKQIQQIGFPKNKVNIWWTCRRQISLDISKYIPSIYNQYSYLLNSNPNVVANAFNCAFEHYSIIRTSYERGFNHILIFEDDVKFLVDIKMFKYFINHIPDDYNICKLHNNVVRKINNSTHFLDKSTNLRSIPIHIKNLKEPLFYEEKECFLSTAAYLINRIGMKSIIESYNSNFTVADHVFNSLGQDIKIYCPNYQLVTTQDWDCPPNEYLWSDLWKLNTSKRFNQFK